MLRPLLLAATACLAAQTALAQSLTIGIGDAVTSIDPHYLNSPTNKNVVCNIYDGLTDTDSTYNIRPSLAESWKRIDDTTWEFKLRPGVRFHDGTPFTAADAMATLERVPVVKNAPQRFTTYIRTIKSMKVVDDLTLQITTSVLDPILPNGIAQIRMIPARVASLPTEEFNNGQAAIGTGPMRFVSYKPGAGVELARNEQYWDKPAQWEKVTFRIIPEGAARVAALLAGDVQVIDLVPSDALAELRRNDAIRVATAQVGLRYIFLALDQSRDGPTPFVTGPNGETLPSNPLKDLRVRKALSLAINRPAIIERVMEGVATATGQMMPKGSFGYVPDIVVPPYDPVQAKKLLAEAGYPNGLKLTIHSTKGRYVNDTRIVQAIAQMWQRIGVQAAIELQPWSTYASRVTKQQYSVMLGAVAAVTSESSQVLRSAMATTDISKGWGGFNWGRYSSPKLDALLTEGSMTGDDRKREDILNEAMRVGAGDVANIPLHLQRTTWAMQKNLTYPGRSDDQTRVLDIRLAQ
ncbi:MAG: ABC transporter substrate-binding protein [Acetobacteraceae bacterium]